MNEPSMLRETQRECERLREQVAVLQGELEQSQDWRGVYTLIQVERAYQKVKWGSRGREHPSCSRDPAWHT